MIWLVQFVPKYISTIGVDFGVKTVVVDNQQVMPPLDRHIHKRISFASCYPPALCISRHDLHCVFRAMTFRPESWRRSRLISGIWPVVKSILKSEMNFIATPRG